MKKSSKTTLVVIVLAVAFSLAGCAPEGHTGLRGAAGQTGATGSAGQTGAVGAPGGDGATGERGFQGLQGLTGEKGASAGATGPAGATGLTGSAGATGLTGPVGASGPAGPAGASAGANIAQYYALMPPDNTFAVAAGADVEFPQDGPAQGSALSRANSSAFILGDVGLYRVYFQVPVNEAGQLVVTLNGLELAYTVAGRAAGTSQISTLVLVQTTAVGSFLTIRNPAGNPVALTISAMAGGNQPSAASLVIEKL